MKFLQSFAYDRSYCVKNIYVLKVYLMKVRDVRIFFVNYKTWPDFKTVLSKFLQLYVTYGITRHYHICNVYKKTIIIKRKKQLNE